MCQIFAMEGEIIVTFYRNQLPLLFFSLQIFMHVLNKKILVLLMSQLFCHIGNHAFTSTIQHRFGNSIDQSELAQYLSHFSKLFITLFCYRWCSEFSYSCLQLPCQKPWFTSTIQNMGLETIDQSELTQPLSSFITRHKILYSYLMIRQEHKI